MRTSTLKPRLEYAMLLVDKILDILNQNRSEIRRINQSIYERSNKNSLNSEFKERFVADLKFSHAIESLRQTRRCMDSVFGLGNIVFVLAPTISIVRTVRSQLFGLSVDADASLGELALILGGIIIDAGHLTGTSLDFDEANRKSCLLLDEAKLIADSKISKQFPNLDFL
ncbi:MAG: hypothetical protein ACT4N5_02215 [Nitrosopumilaceae archaeon]